MELDPHQYGVLRTYQRWRKRPPTYGSLVRRNVQPLGLLALCCIGAGFLFYVVRLPAISFSWPDSGSAIRRRDRPHPHSPGRLVGARTRARLVEGRAGNRSEKV